MACKYGKLSYQKVDLTGKTAIVTGANSGIGYMTTRDLMKMGARVIMACRSPSKAEDALQSLRKDAVEEFGESTTAHERVEFMKLDMASLKSTMNFIEEFKRKGYPLHLLICNGGCLIPDKQMTEDGNEMMFQVNYLSHFLLTLHLLPVMRQSGEDCRIVSVSSMGHARGNFDLTNIQAQKNFGAWLMYGNSKLFQIMNMYSLHRRLKDTNISVYSLHPGAVETPVLKDFEEKVGTAMKLGVKFSRLIGMSREADEGAVTTLHVATNPQAPKHSGSYFDSCKPKTPSGAARKVKDQEELWNYSLEKVKGYVTEDLLKDLQVDVEELKRKK